MRRPQPAHRGTSRTRASDVERACVAPAVDRFAVDVFEDEVRLAARSDTGVEQPRDVRMREPGEELTLARETISAAAAEQR